MRQLSFAFLQAGYHIARGTLKPREASSQPFTEGVVLRRIDPAKNMSRFYSLEVERDLLGRVVLSQAMGTDRQRRQDPPGRAQRGGRGNGCSSGSPKRQKKEGLSAYNAEYLRTGVKLRTIAIDGLDPR